MNTYQAKKMAIDLIKQHNLTDWVFEFDYSVRRFGRCSYKKKIISLSKKLTELNSEEHVKNTILHEIAHALIIGKYPPGEHHGKLWKQTAVSIGCTGSRTYSNKVILPKHKYEAICKNCGTITTYNKKLKISCGKCSARFNKKYLLKFKPVSS